MRYLIAYKGYNDLGMIIDSNIYDLEGEWVYDHDQSEKLFIGKDISVGDFCRKGMSYFIESEENLKDVTILSFTEID